MGLMFDKDRTKLHIHALQVSGDYTIPAGAPLPRSAASLALPPAAVVSTAAGSGARGAAAAVSTPVAAFDPASGRWRIQVPPAVAAWPAEHFWNSCAS
jgi:hypothetical protein